VFDDIETMEDLVSLSVVQTSSGELIQGNQSPVGRTNGLEIPSDVIKKNYYLISVGDGLYKLANKKSGELAFTQNDVPFLIDLKKVTQ